ncbi:MAG: hypothetical protein AAF823_06700 [Planctomycetota bacterium]
MTWLAAPKRCARLLAVVAMCGVSVPATADEVVYRETFPRGADEEQVESARVTSDGWQIHWQPTAASGSNAPFNSNADNGGKPQDLAPVNAKADTFETPTPYGVFNLPIAHDMRLDAGAARWLPMTFTPGQQLAIDVDAEAVGLPEGNVTAFGLFIDKCSGHVAFDSFEIQAAPR